MNRKIQSAKKKRAIQAEQKLLQDTNIEVSQKLIESTERLYELVNGKQDYDFARLEKQLTKIDKHLDLSQYFTNLERSIENNSPLTHISKTKIQDFSKLLEAVKNNKPIETKIDLNKLEKAVVNIEQYIRENTEASDQGAEKYKPYRRVVKVGNRFMFDDILTFAGGGGGGGQTNGLTDTELRASPVPVSMTSDVEIGAVELKNGTDDTRAVVTAGNALKVDGSAVTQPISGTVTATAQPGVDIGDVTVNNTTATPVPVQPPLSGFLNVSIDQTGNNNAVDVLTMPTVTETNSAAIKTAVEIIDNAIAGNEMQVDVITMPTVTTTEATPSTIYNGKKTVTTAGTRVALAASQAVKSVTIKALATNTGYIYVGDTSVASTNGFQLSAGETVSMDIANLNTVNLDSSVSGESVTYIGVN